VGVKHTRSMQSEIRNLKNMKEKDIYRFTEDINAPYDLVKLTKDLGELHVGGITIPADAV
jgi:pyridoxal 5'-phosphate synthase pdxS subunit